MTSLMNFEDFATMAARATAAPARESKHQSNHRRTKQTVGSEILMPGY